MLLLNSVDALQGLGNRLLTMSDVKRAGKDTNWPALLRLVQDSFAYMEARIDPPSSMHRLTADNIARHGVEQEIWIIGPAAAPDACMFLTEKPDCLYLGKIAVAPHHRGKGFARLLIDCAEARARAKGLPALELQSRIELTEVHATFAKMGFVKTGESAHAGYPRPTSITMKKSCDSIETTDCYAIYKRSSPLGRMS